MAKLKLLFTVLCVLTGDVFAHSPQSNSDKPLVDDTACLAESRLSAKCSKTPSSVFDASGTLWTVFVHGNHVYLTHSIDAGNNFAKAVAVNKYEENIAAYGENRPQIAIGQNNQIYISWIKKTKRRNADEVRFAYSTDHGQSFSEAVTINDDGIEASHRYNSLIVNERGEIYISWLDKRDAIAHGNTNKAYAGTALYFAKSIDEGRTFQTNQKIADHSCECCRVITQLDSQGNAIVLWRHIFSGNIRDHAIAKLDDMLADRNNKFTRVTFDEWTIDACPHHGPHMSIDKTDNIHLVWFNGDEGKAGLHYGLYKPGDGTLQKQHHFDASPTASRPQVKVFDGKLYIVWKRLINDDMSVQMITSDDMGNTWSPEQTLFQSRAESDHPQLIADKNALLASWWTKDHGMRIKTLNETRIDATDTIVKPFHNNSLDSIKQYYANKDYLLVLWSLDCPPCFKEMELLSEYFNAHKLPELILISSNGEEDLDAIHATLKKFKLENANNWYFDGIVESLRYRIDPTWYGELPRSYFFSKEGEQYPHKGLLKEETLKKWLDSLL